MVDYRNGQWAFSSGRQEERVHFHQVGPEEVASGEGRWGQGGGGVDMDTSFLRHNEECHLLNVDSRSDVS